MSVDQHQPSRRALKLQDIADHLGVSIRTVSRVINERPGPAPSTRQRVLEAVEALGYRPNLVARGLVTQQTYTLGLVVTYLTDPFFPELANGIQIASDRHGYLVYLTSSEGDARRQHEVLDSLAARGVDGLVVFPVRGAEAQLVDVAEHGVPIIVVDHLVEHPRIGSVVSDTEAGAHSAVDYLLGRGRSTIGMLSLRSALTGPETRETGFIAAAKEAGIWNEDLLVRTDESLEGGRTGALELLSRRPDVNALFAYNDLMAVGAVRAIEELGRRVPDDVAVIGVDDVAISAMVRPALTTIRIDRANLGARAVDLLMRMREDPGLAAPHDVLDVTLVVRESA